MRTTDTVAVDYPDAVKRGHAWMTEHYPNELLGAQEFLKSPHVDQFDMARPSRCMLVDIGYSKVEDKYGSDWMAEHGFKLDDTDHYNGHFDYAQLRQLWIDELT